MRIAIIGSGIAGLGAAYLLHRHHQITVYEQAERLGGHSCTRTITTPNGEIAVDTGFIVFNQRNYPNLTALFKQQQVPIAPSTMSFGVSVDQGRLEYSTHNLFGLFAQPSNLVRPAYWRILRDIIRFNRQAKTYLMQHPAASIGDFLSELRLSLEFQNYYLLAMSAAIWSTPIRQMRAMPAKTLIQFFDNHGLLTLNNQPQWYTVRGGSQVYVQRLSAPFRDTIRQNTKVVRVTRSTNQVAVTTITGETVDYDHVILACHSDQALRLLATPNPAEQTVLSAIRYQPNRVVLHSDTSLMPRRRRAWASWVSLSDTTQTTSAVSLTYWMNNLQPLDTQQPLLVTLNPSKKPDPTLTYHKELFNHPALNTAAIAAQAQLPAIQGRDRIWYCGAWQGYGFHEDGLNSAIAVATQLGATVPWK